MAWTTTALAVAGDTLTAAGWNAQVKANMDWLSQAGVTAWAAFTPTWTGSGSNPAIANGTLAGVYSLSAKRFMARVLCLAGSTTTFGTGTYSWALPVTVAAAASTRPCGFGFVSDTGTSLRIVAAHVASTTTFGLYHTDTAAVVVSQTSPMTWASTDYAHLALLGEAA